MIYIENIYLCLVAPLLVACFCCDRDSRKPLLCIVSGMTICLLSAYINTFFVQLYHTDLIYATLEITPFIEEVMKVLPLIFYLLVFEPKPKQVFSAMLMISIGFASFENICYLTEYGSHNLTYLLIRGFGTGAMHIVCGAIVGYGLMFTWGHRSLKLLGTFGVLCIAITFHAEFNLLMHGSAQTQLLAAIMPMGCILLAQQIRHWKRTTTPLQSG